MVTKCLAGKEHPDLFLSIFKQTKRYPVTKRHLISILKRTVCSVSFALEKGNPGDGGAWHATVRWIAKSRSALSD